jgi:hypothetical protein
MKHAKFSILLTFLVIQNSFSQITADNGQPRQSYIGASIGTALPIGAYADKNIYNTGAGFATMGLRFEGSIAKILQRYWGLALNYKNQTNNVDEQAFATQYAQKYGGNNWNVHCSPWKINAFLIGSYNAFPIGETKLVSLEMKLLFGMVRALTPQTELNGYWLNGLNTAQQNLSIADAFAFSGGLGLRFEVSKTMFFILQTDYFGANPKFNLQSVFPNPLGAPYSLNTSSQNISTLSFSLCFAYRIN